ncbi:MAG: PAS domain S-box protein [Candidatus Marinimicrobia bacterium]|jgi:PAS domain S-box-containing protein|nr:PAS domain S-box protein [Candidatus Neomarinimicrobiota bacterium]MBT3635173.1 PAS domain S-box protein [Candidatus Neomarinimicrobiota bacterium]MBT3683932.1 PAS domain S-box protein [Candidatus Neomarinimicrobiota bacterium]MBT3760858.1 PAS domain S-box protein [Candidatus Neomarinimicrobiota bacterium]MBT3896902.1 PAS domain S-box protein [Candidatus Neomarinimicrobiota bacterium]
MSKKNKSNSTLSSISKIATNDIFQELFEELPIGFALCEIISDEQDIPIDYRFLLINPAFEKITGMKINATLGKTIKEIYPDVEQSWIEFYGAVAVTQRPDETENYNHNTDKYYNVKSFSPEKGKFTMLFSDITERKKAEVAIFELSKLNKMILDNAGDGIYGLDLDGNTTFLNPAAAKMIGWEIEEILGKRQHDLLHHTKPDGTIYDRNDCPIYAAYKDGKVHRVVDEIFWRKDGSSFAVEYISSPIRNEQGKLSGAVVTFKDISEHKLAENELKKIKILLNDTEKIGRIGGWAVDLNTMTQTWTDEIYRIHEVDQHFKPDVNKGLNFYIPSARPIIEKAFNHTIKTGEPFDLELEIITAKGKRRWIHSVGKAHQEDGVTKAVSGSFQDITERKLVDKKLIDKTKQLTQKTDELKKHRLHLEEMIENRTRELELKNQELDKAMKVFVGRELKIRDLQNKINAMGGEE